MQWRLYGVVQRFLIMGKTIPKPHSNESLEDYRKRLIVFRNQNPLVKLGLIKKRKL